VTRLDNCGNLVDSACSSATTSSFIQITLTKVFQDRQDALRIDANGDICVDKPKAPILRWYEVVAELCRVDPEMLNIMTAEPLVLNDATIPEAVGWDTVVGSAELSNFALEFWVGTEDDECDDGEVDFGYGILPWVYQANLLDLTIGNDVITFSVSGITKAGSPWGVGPYNVLINQTGVNAGLPGPLLTPIPADAHKRFFWTQLGPPLADCGCTDVTPALEMTPLAGVVPQMVTVTFPTDSAGNPLLPAVIDWDDLTPNTVVTSGTSTTHNYTLAGTYDVTYRLTTQSGPTWTVQAIFT
jgi:hypothetical protein